MEAVPVNRNHPTSAATADLVLELAMIAVANLVGGGGQHLTPGRGHAGLVLWRSPQPH